MENTYLNIVVRILDHALDSDDHKVSLAEITEILKEERGDFTEILSSDVHRTLCNDLCDMYGIDLQPADLP